ncbi:uncharacterized protein PV09_04091 [Verruconis gallopava]|uniref:Amino acid permease/ SLC12A domain-containing protein n=1 Tax=Verruconis gallopava TaxID=253628 RepID=A0A0D1YW61_9PEZI|nr:uncharacterized protein PV09_04091 [Verruconis gallopava]KIW04922.1 hypothetical protein PV09_04091 [Verruconis gallopava]
MSSIGYKEEKEKAAVTQAENIDGQCLNNEVNISQNSMDHTHRGLTNRHLQFIAIGGTIGTALFVSIGGSLVKAGPASLLLAFILYSTVVLSVNSCLAEMVTYLPISSSFIRFAGRWVDDAFGFAVGYNFFIYEAVLIPFEMTAFAILLTFWTDQIPVAATVAFLIVLYAFLNFFAVSYYGEAEFWLACGKVFLIIGLALFTFFTMIGVNPQRTAYGFRYWRDPGPFASYLEPGSTGRLIGFLMAVIQAGFTIAGPEYISMAAGEVKNPRTSLPLAYRTMRYRFAAFFIGGALCVGIICPYNDPTLVAINLGTKEGGGTGAASPYVIGMNRLNIPVLPHITNALILTSILSAGNSYVYCSSRSLFGLALDGKAPKIFTRCTSAGVPIYCVFMSLGISCLAFLQVSNSSSVVLSWFFNLITASQLINFACACVTYMFFRRAFLAQGFSRDNLPYKSHWQPFLAWYGFFGCCLVMLLNGFYLFISGSWNTKSFFFCYSMIAVFPILFFGRKWWSRTSLVKSTEADLVSGLEEIESYERTHPIEKPKSTIWRICSKIIGF